MSDEIPKTAGWRPHPRYPDPAVISLDPDFDKLTIFSAAIERLYTGCRWAEGPVYLAMAAIYCGATFPISAF